MERYFRGDASGFYVRKSVQPHQHHPCDPQTDNVIASFTDQPCSNRTEDCGCTDTVTGSISEA